MKPLGHHLVFRLENDHNLAAPPGAGRAIARAALAAAEPFALLALNWVDTHGHGVVAGDRASAGECARRIEIALSVTLSPGVRFAPARIKPIFDAAHLRNAFLYVLGQNAHHGVPTDPIFDASNVPDLLGARVNGTWTVGHVRTHLPRIRSSDILTATGLADPDSQPFALEPLADAAAGAIARTHLGGLERVVVDVRRAAVHVAHAEPTSVLAAALGIAPRTVRDLRASSPDPQFVRAVRLQLGLRAATPVAVVGTVALA